MIGDPNWLYSTIAQSSAAIVAIVGGFITASVLMLTAEKRSLKNQLADKKSQLEALKKQPTYIASDPPPKPEEIEEWKRRFSLRMEKISQLETEISDLEARLKAFAYPPHLKWGILILLCFAFFSIILPVRLILMEEFSPIMKEVTFGMFMAGLVAVIAYIVLQIRTLRR